MARALPVLSALMLAICGCSQLKDLVTDSRPRITDVRASVTGLSLEGVDVRFDVDVYNAYPIDIRAPRLRYALDVEGSNWAESEMVTGVHLPSKAKGTLALPVRFAYAQLFQTFTQKTEWDEFEYQLRGAVLFDAYGETIELPCSHKGKLPVFHLPSFQEIDVQTAEASLAGARVTITARVGNPNSFLVNLRDLGYEVRLGDRPLGRVAINSGPGSLRAKDSAKLELSAAVSATGLAGGLLSGGDWGEPRIIAVGAIETPHGQVRLPGGN